MLILADGIRICVNKIVAYQPSGPSILFILEDGSRQFHSLPDCKAVQLVVAELDELLGAELLNKQAIVTKEVA